MNSFSADYFLADKFTVDGPSAIAFSTSKARSSTQLGHLQNITTEQEKQDVPTQTTASQCYTLASNMPIVTVCNSTVSIVNHDI